jgi:2-octaprenyl-6-methoxyphenol hydroxylase
MPEQNPIVIHGSGSTARITALALAAAMADKNIPIWLAPPHQENAQINEPDTHDWTSVLALSPAAKNMLELLGVWARLDLPTAPVCDMAVYGDAAAMAHQGGLDFNPTQNTGNEEPQNEVNVLAHIVSRTSLDRAIHAAFDAAFKTASKTAGKTVGKNANGALNGQAPALVDFDNTTGRADFADGTEMTAALLVDCARMPRASTAAPPWRQSGAAHWLAHDYDAAALVCAVDSDRPHDGQAVQIFLPSGPLALLPLPDPKKRALIWSLPQARATALADIEADIFAHELNQTTQGHAGALTADGPRALQKLSLALAENYVDGHICLLGEAAHIIHPLAGQGFNLALRDAAQLADTLYDAQSLGLALNGPHALADYQALRRADGGTMAATTHFLAEIFSGPQSRFTAPLARLGLALTGRMARSNKTLAARFRAQANGGTPPLPRLMRGRGF